MCRFLLEVCSIGETRIFRAHEFGENPFIPGALRVDGDRIRIAGLQNSASDSIAAGSRRLATGVPPPPERRVLRRDMSVALVRHSGAAVIGATGGAFAPRRFRFRDRCAMRGQFRAVAPARIMDAKGPDKDSARLRHVRNSGNRSPKRLMELVAPLPSWDGPESRGPFRKGSGATRKGLSGI